MRLEQINKGIKLLNIIDVIGIAIILLIALALQFFLKELPCPLCLLQRLGLLGMAFGFLLNIRFKPRPIHYSLSLLAALLTGFIALRQIALHVVPGSGAYGDPFLGFHLYTWVFILSVLQIIYISIILGFFNQYLINYEPDHTVALWGKIAIALLLFVAIDNAIVVYFECGLQSCPDNPVAYLHRL